MIAPPGADDPAGIAATVRELVGTTPWGELSWTRLLQELELVGRASVPCGRLAEGHIDAVRILAQAGRTPEPAALYGVWASRSRGAAVTARTDDGHVGLQLSGSMPFASGCGVIDRSLVTVVTDEQPSRHLLLDADVRGWPYRTDSWQTDAMGVSRSFTVELDEQDVPLGSVVGADGFYLDRPGFLPGGIGVAAVWTGGAQAVSDVLLGWLSRAPLDAVQSLRVGAITLEIDTCRALLQRAAAVLDAAAEPAGMSIAELCTLTRAGVGAAVRRVLATARDCAGPAGAAHAPLLAGAIADLDLYVRQQHPDRDLTALAGKVVRG